MNTIKQLRKEKGLTQVQLAEILNIDQTTISKWELNKASPDTPILIKLSKIFDVSTDYLLGLSTFYYPDRIKANNYPPNEKAEELLNLFNTLDPMYQTQILEYARYITMRVNNTKNYKGV